MANKITLVRIVSLPLLIWFLSAEGRWMPILSLVTFVILALTDLLDGYVARNIGQVTRTGKLLDPVADKLLIMTALLPMVARGIVPAWMGIIILGREFLVNGLRMIAAVEHTVIAAGTWGKYKTIVYIVSLSIIMVAPGLPFARIMVAHDLSFARFLHYLGLGGLLLGMALSVISAAEYFTLYKPSSHSPPPPEALP